MGAGLVGATLNPEWARRLNTTERLILTTMAHTAHDRGSDDKPRAEYWAGHEHLMTVILGDLPKADTTERRNAERKIERAIANLIRAGAIQRLNHSGRGHRARYRLTLDLNQPTLEEA